MEEEIRETAENSRLNLGDEEVEALKTEFEEILEIFDKIDDIDTKDTKPSFHPVETDIKSRSDKVEETLEEKFDNTENVDEGYFKGPSAQ